jgi:hypothetical protein
MRSDESVRIRWKDHFEFHVSARGECVRWRRLTIVHDEVLFTYLLNQVLSHCMVAKGMEPLHATCVVVDGMAMAFLGDTGYGKSTLAAAFLKRGYPLLTDDLLMLHFVSSGVLAFPSLARLKLHPDSSDATMNSRRSMPMNNFTTKMILPLGQMEHVSHSVPLRAVYVLPTRHGSTTICIRRATGHRALIPIVRNTFNTMWLTEPRLVRQFAFASRLASAVPIRYLSFPRQLEALPRVVDRLLLDIARVGSD